MIQKQRREALYISVATFVVFFFMVACIRTHSTGVALVFSVSYFFFSWKTAAKKRAIVLDVSLVSLIAVMLDISRFKGAEISEYRLFNIQLSLFAAILLFEMIRWHMRLMPETEEGISQNKAVA